MNEVIFFAHTFLMSLFTLAALKLGKEALISFICLQSILANLFVTKQMTLFGFDVTCSDVYMVGALFGLNLLQEFFGKKYVYSAIAISFFIVIFYLIMTQLHLAYLPNSYDATQTHFAALLNFMPRIIIASIVTYVLVQLLDTQLYSALKVLFKGRYPFLRNLVSLSCSQSIDTVMFSFLGLYGLVGSITHVIVVSLAIKIIAISLTAPFTTIAQRLMRNNNAIL
ncbi:queuosine precursor transporter [Candidatus Babeliales bacterium]|nr:queuosine precursor transporter [Candidatus Babeliales bacterium]